MHAPKTQTIARLVHAVRGERVLFDADLAGLYGVSTAALNQALATASGQPGTVVADVFSAFQAATVPVGGHTCNAGLLNASPQNQFTCDIHPSQSGQMLIARTVAQTFAATEESAH